MPRTRRALRAGFHARYGRMQRSHPVRAFFQGKTYRARVLAARAREAKALAAHAFVFAGELNKHHFNMFKKIYLGRAGDRLEKNLPQKPQSLSL